MEWLREGVNGLIAMTACGVVAIILICRFVGHERRKTK